VKFLVTKTCLGVFDTKPERQRIRFAFQRNKEIRQRLLSMMDAIEAGHWGKAKRMIDGKWWQGFDEESGSRRLDFIGMLELKDPKEPCYSASGFDGWATYKNLICRMYSKASFATYKVERVKEQ